MSRGFSILVLFALLVTGCADFGSALKKNGDVAVQGRERREEMVRIFEGKRDRAQYEAALGRWQEGDTTGCHEQLKELLTRNPKNLEARLLSAELSLFEDRPDAALEHMQQALVDHPNEAKAQHTMGLVLESQGQVNESLSHYRAALELEPGNEVYQLSCQSAEAAASQAAQLTSGPAELETPTANYEMASDDASAGLSPVPPVTTDLTRTSDQLSTKQFLSKGAAALADGDEGASVSWLTKAMTAEPDNAQIPLRAAAQALQLEQPEVAIKLLAIARQRFPDSANAARLLGTAQYRRGDFEAAELALQQALSLDKASGLSYFLMGCTLRKLGKEAEAAEHLQTAARLDSRFAVQR